MQINAKIGNMRKAVDWTVYPPQKDGRIVIQASNRIAVFNPNTGEGLLSKRQSGGAYFLHLSPLCGASPVKVPREVIEAAQKAQPQPGQHIGGGVFIA